jgi:hypothetical protein
MLSAFAGGGGSGGVGGVFDGRGGGAALAPPPPQFSASNFIPIRLDSQDPERKRVRDELVVRQDFSFPLVYFSVGNADPEPDPHVFGPPGSGSISRRYGSGSDSIPFLLNVLSGLQNACKILTF